MTYTDFANSLEIEAMTKILNTNFSEDDKKSILAYIILKPHERDYLEVPNTKHRIDLAKVLHKNGADMKKIVDITHISRTTQRKLKEEII